MTDSIIEQVMDVFTLNEKQRTAVLERGKDVVVTAGAGSGKTSTLVARYVSLLAEGVAPRRIAAITFTKKAAMEMRSRVRRTLVELQNNAADQSERQRWAGLSAQIDSARIGTIHSLCTEILRNHPAEAGVDPRFEVLDEGLSAVLRSQAVDDTLRELVEDERFMPLLEKIPLRNLVVILGDLLEKRLDAQEVFKKKIDNRARLALELRERMNSPLTGGLIADLRRMGDYQLTAEAGEKLADMVKELLRCWSSAESALSENDPVCCAGHLFEARRSYLKKSGGGKDSAVKQIIAELQENFDTILDPLTQGKGSRDSKPSLDAENLFENLQPLLGEAFSLVNQAYQSLVEKRQALDFDDLEYYAQQLLIQEKVRERWRRELDAVLVDEYQDTNQRQRDIVNALTGKPGSLFIVGDMRQSIYRFRRADVTVFREEQERIRQEGGRLIDLDRTYRAHEKLLDTTSDILSCVIGTAEDPDRKYYVPYTPLVADKKDIPHGVQPPHVEFVIGTGDDADSARPLAARALVERLHQLKDEKQIQKWDEVALLFRASTGFPYYEEALEDAGIPFVTVAGRGFYDRPEIRDLVNILRALADPLDDLSFAGLLRSPAFGMRDASLYQLRQTGLPYWNALQGDLSVLFEEDRASAKRALDILQSLFPEVDRIPVAELLKKVVDKVDYRAILASADLKTDGKEASAAGGRLWRNLDKLLEDAQVSQSVNVRDFLDMLATMNDAGAREGEASSVAEGSVCLMTIHKAKGLEFPVVVLADAGRRANSRDEQVYLSNDLGVVFRLDPAPMLYNLAKEVDKDQEECETLRILYVAMTRAKSKLLISSHATVNDKGEVRLSSWAKDLVDAVNLSSLDFKDHNGEPFEYHTFSKNPLRVWCLQEKLPERIIQLPIDSQEEFRQSALPPLYHPTERFGQIEAGEEIDRQEEIHSWRATRPDRRVSGRLLGKMVHKAIQRWLFPDDPQLVVLLETETFNAGLASEAMRREAVSRAAGLMARLRSHSLWEEINSAQERYAELPYTSFIEGKMENRVIDLLYRDSGGWHLLDFKTDPIHTHAHKQKLLEVYAPQVKRYAEMAASRLNQPVRARICFLDSQGSVDLVAV